MGKARRQQPRKNEFSSPDWQAVAICPACGKKCYIDKKSAKAASKIHHSDDHLSAYQCRSTSPKRPNPAPWHLGHLDGRIMNGEVTRTEVYERQTRVYTPQESARQAIARIARASQK